MSDSDKQPIITVEDIRNSIGAGIREEWDRRLEGKSSLVDVPLYLSSHANEKTLMDAGLWWRPVKLLEPYDTLGVTIPAGTIGHISFSYPITASIFNFELEAPVSGLIKSDTSKVGGIPWHLLALVDLQEDEEPPKDWEKHNLYAGLPQPNNLPNRLLRANTWMLWLLVAIWLIALFMQAEKGSVAEVMFQGSWWVIGINLCLLACLRGIANPLTSFLKHPFSIFKTGFALLFGCFLLIIPLKTSVPTSTLLGASLLYLSAVGLYFWTAMGKKPLPVPDSSEDISPMETETRISQPEGHRYAITVDCDPGEETDKNLAECIIHLYERISDYKNISLDPAPIYQPNNGEKWIGITDNKAFSITRHDEPGGLQHWQIEPMNAPTARKLMNMVRTFLVNAEGSAKVINLTRDQRLQPLVEFNQALKKAGNDGWLVSLQRSVDELEIGFIKAEVGAYMHRVNGIIISMDTNLVDGQDEIDIGVAIAPVSVAGELDEIYNQTVDTKRVITEYDEALKHCHILSVGIYADLQQQLMDDIVYIRLQRDLDGVVDEQHTLYFQFHGGRVERLTAERVQQIQSVGSYQHLEAEDYISKRFYKSYPLKPEELDPVLLDTITQRCLEEIRECSELTKSRGMYIIMEVLEEFDQQNIEIPYDLWKHIAQRIFYPETLNKDEPDNE